MLLIIFLGLIAKLALVSGDCDVGTQKVKNFDFTKATGTWHALLHSPNDIGNNMDCFTSTLAAPEGNISLVTVQAYIISEQRPITVHGNITNWNSTGWDATFGPAKYWTGRFYIIGTDYNSYRIIKICPFGSNQPYVYVSYRTRHPDEETVKKVMKELEDNNIDENQLVEVSADHCQV